MAFVGSRVIIGVVFDIGDAVNYDLIAIISVVCADNVINVVDEFDSCSENYAGDRNSDTDCNPSSVPPALTPLMNKIMGGTTNAANKGENRNVNPDENIIPIF